MYEIKYTERDNERNYEGWYVEHKDTGYKVYFAQTHHRTKKRAISLQRQLTRGFKPTIRSNIKD